MNIFKKFSKNLHKRRIQQYIDTLGTRTGWSIEANEVEKLYRIDPSEMIHSLRKKICDMRHQFATICVTMSRQCWNRHVKPVINETEFKLLRAETGSRIVVTSIGKHTAGNIMTFRLLYRGFTWTRTHEDSKVDFSYDLFKDLGNYLERTRFDITDQVWFVRHLNWLACTINDIEERIKNWEIEVSYK